jgi:hypothetical protein
MSVKKSERFVISGVHRNITKEYPPAEFIFQAPKEDIELFYLGISNKKDLIPPVEETRSMEEIDQFIYTSRDGSLFEVCIYKEIDHSYLFAIRTRQE